MHLTQIKPSEQQMVAIMAYPKNTPVTMVNIIKFKEKTENGGETGKEAYARYYKNAQKFIIQSQAKLIWKGAVATTVIGDAEQQPDMIFLVEYPTVDHFMQMVANPEYQKIAVDRSISLEYGGLIACQTLT